MSTGLAWGGGDCAGSARLWGPAPPGWDLPAGPWLIGRCSNLRLHQRAVGSTWPFHPRGAGEGLPAALQVSHHPEPGVGVGFWPCLWFLAWGLLQSSLPPDKDLSGYKPQKWYPQCLRGRPRSQGAPPAVHSLLDLDGPSQLGPWTDPTSFSLCFHRACVSAPSGLWVSQSPTVPLGCPGREVTFRAQALGSGCSLGLRMLGLVREMASVSSSPPVPGPTPSAHLRPCLMHFSPASRPAPHPCLVPSSYPPPDTGTCHGLYPGSWASWSERAESLVTLARHCPGSPSLLLSSPASPPQGSWSPHPNLCHPTYQLPLLQTHIKAPGSVGYQLP